MQKLFYVSNSRDYNEQGNINENQYLKGINDLLAQGWEVSSITPVTPDIVDPIKPYQKETAVAYVLLEKPIKS